MNHTQNYQLNQWVKSDKVQRVDFNADNAKIDAALGALAETSAEHTETLAGHTAAIAKLGNCAIWTTTYNGNDAASVTITCPHPPVLVYVQHIVYNYGEYVLFVRGSDRAIAHRGGSYSMLVPSWPGNSITWREENGSTDPQMLFNRSGNKFIVVALMNTSM